MWLQGLAVSMGLLTEHKPKSEINLSASIGRSDAYNPLANFYLCKGGRWIMLANFQADRYWADFARALGIEELIHDAKFHDMDARGENRGDLIAILDGKFAEKTYHQWAEILERSGDFIFSPVQRLSELEDDPQVIANNYIIDFDHPVAGPSKWLQTPLGYNKTPFSTRKMAPAHGENTEEILIETFGYTWDDIATLQNEGVIL